MKVVAANAVAVAAMIEVAIALIAHHVKMLSKTERLMQTTIRQTPCQLMSQTACKSKRVSHASHALAANAVAAIALTAQTARICV